MSFPKRQQKWTARHCRAASTTTAMTPRTSLEGTRRGRRHPKQDIKVKSFHFVHHPPPPPLHCRHRRACNKAPHLHRSEIVRKRSEIYEARGKGRGASSWNGAKVVLFALLLSRERERNAMQRCSEVQQQHRGPRWPARVMDKLELHSTTINKIDERKKIKRITKRAKRINIWR